jgi:hypothetical protein
MSHKATNGFSLRRVIADALAITVSFLALAALDGWIRAGFAFVPTATAWQQFGYGLAFTPLIAILAFGPAALVVEVLGTTRRQAFMTSLILGLGAGAVLEWVTGDPRSF